MQNNIRKLRRERGLSFQELGEMIGSDQSVIWRIENDVTKKPRPETLASIAKALGVDVDTLLSVDVNRAEEDEVFAAFLQLNAQHRQIVRAMIHALNDTTAAG